jgi:hypothetical protein
MLRFLFGLTSLKYLGNTQGTVGGYLGDDPRISAPQYLVDIVCHKLNLWQYVYSFRLALISTVISSSNKDLFSYYLLASFTDIGLEQICKHGLVASGWWQW